MEICYNNTYGTVCDDHWDKLDADVVCARAGFASNGELSLINSLPAFVAQLRRARTRAKCGCRIFTTRSRGELN